MQWFDDARTLEFVHGAVLFLGLILYAVLGGADFGGGVWDLLAHGPRAGAQRRAIAHAIGPIWEANHVWLIFVIVLTFTIFPPVFAAISEALYWPLLLALVGIVLRGAAFVFRQGSDPAARAYRVWERVFAVASAVTPALFGMTAAAISSGRIDVPGNGSGNGSGAGPATAPVFAWLGPFPLVIGAVAVATCAFLAAVYLTLETEGRVAEDFRRRAIWSGAVVGALVLLALPLTRRDAPVIWASFLDGIALVAIPLMVALATVTGIAVIRRRYVVARIAAILEVTVVLSGWMLAQFPFLVVPDLAFRESAASLAMMQVTLVIYIIGAVLMLPSLWFLFAIFKSERDVIGRRVAESPANLPERYGTADRP